MVDRSRKPRKPHDTNQLAKLITDRRLGGEVTARNRRTLTKLLELADEPSD